MERRGSRFHTRSLQHLASKTFDGTYIDAQRSQALVRDIDAWVPVELGGSSPLSKLVKLSSQDHL